jgi:hypothetical protein
VPMTVLNDVNGWRMIVDGMGGYAVVDPAGVLVERRLSEVQALELLAEVAGLPTESQFSRSVQINDSGIATDSMDEGQDWVESIVVEDSP